MAGQEHEAQGIPVHCSVKHHGVKDSGHVGQARKIYSQIRGEIYRQYFAKTLL